MSKRHILVVDDEPDIRNLVQEILEDEGFSVSVAENATIARQSITKTRPDLILLDIWMPDIDGITLLKEWKNSFGQKTPIIMMSGHGNVETAVEATRSGAYDFIEKPLSTAKLLLTIKHALETYSLKSENLKLNQITMSKLEPIGKSKVINNLKSQLSQIAKHDAYVLMRGESGTNKELLARYLHSLSSRSDKPFLTVNISTLNSENPQKELFGFVENDQTQEGLLDNAAEGTLFINDIGELSTNLQSYFLDVLKTKQYTRIGGSKPINLNIRVVAATRYDIELLIKEGVFIDELYYLMNVLPINIPSLHEHFEDIPELLEYYVNQFIEFESLPYRKFSVSAQNRLRSYKWPGNESELKNLVQRLLIMGTEEIINVDEIESYLEKSEVQQKQYDTEIFNFCLLYTSDAADE